MNSTKHKFAVISFSLTLLCSTYSSSTFADHGSKQQQVIRVPSHVFEDREIYFYFISLLTLALDKTHNDGVRYAIQPDPYNANQDRQLKQVKEGSTDVTWAVTSIERERENLAVYVPLVRGLLGYRVFIVHPGAIEKYQSITAETLQQRVSVQGYGWPDTDILRANHYKVEEVVSTILFKLIDTQMADYFPRSVIEVDYELISRSDMALSLEPSLAFYYPSPMYFFVSKRNEKLAQRLKTGLDIALQDGSFTTLFNQQQFSKSAKEMLQKRRIITLDNPALTPQSKHALTHYSNYLIKK